jgi:hypothetical protein
VKKSDDDERRGGRTYIGPSDPVLHHATGRDREINTLLRKASYSSQDRDRILELLETLGLRQDDEGGGFALLRQNRGQLVRRRQTGDVEIVASGRADWVGWVELKANPSTIRPPATPHA